ncbi:MAG: GDYXXLXY domain-containing protein [Peptococcaceae bacterium]|jgi:uncharacterized membrane-anchored protein|nr:GDYXXLXY domain-containing protein [Peptococcaceae bacterium]MDH7524894.1 GDYXXLXY domain-containing protein [Peptococcaceae bacterium]
MINKFFTIKKTSLFILILFLQLAILAGMVFNNQLIILRGERITLKVEPVDPRSLFQGDYVRLEYPINRLNLKNIEHDFDPIYAEISVYKGRARVTGLAGK